MNEKLLHTPEGVRDIYDEEYRRKLEVMHRIHHVLDAYSFQRIQTPTFEFFDIFNRDKGSAASNEMFKLFDRENNTLVLRPDITPSIARCVAKYYESEELPIRLSYEGNTFMNTPHHQGKLCEVTQIGAELINDDSSAADAEIIAAVIDCFATTGIHEFQIEIGEVEYFKGLIEEASIDEATELTIRNYIHNKNFFGLEEYVRALPIKEEYKNAFSSFDSLFGGVEMLERAKKLVNNQRSLDAIDRLEKVYRAISYYGYEKHIGFDFSMLSRYQYYTGLIFRGYTYGTGDAVVKGGRYNSLLRQFGKDAPSIGFAFVIDELMLAITRQNIEVALKQSDTMILYHPAEQELAIKLAKDHRTHGMNISLIRKSARKEIEDYITYAKNHHFGGIVYFHSDKEVELINVKDDTRTMVDLKTVMKGI